MKEDKPRNLVEICNKTETPYFRFKIHDIDYCTLAFAKKQPIKCPYISELPDHNDLYQCQKKEYDRAKEQINMLEKYNVN